MVQQKRPKNRRKKTPRSKPKSGLSASFSKKGRLTLTGILAFSIGSIICANIFTENVDVEEEVALSVDAPKADDSYAPLSLQPERSIGPAEVVPVEQLNPAMTEVINHRYVQQLPDGKEVTYSLLPHLQKRAGQLLSQNEVPFGAVVAIDPRDGRILALVDYRHGHPDAGGFALKASQPAASLFKIISTAALLEVAGISPDDSFCYHGGKKGVTEELLTPNPAKDKKCNTLSEALAQSTNTIFARLADQKLNGASLQQWAERFGFNIEIPFIWQVDRSLATLPEDRIAFAGAAAGFHHTTISPFHASLIAAAIGNKGKMPQPRIVEKITDGQVNLYQHSATMLGDLVTPHTAGKLTSMLKLTTESGTASRYFSKAAPSLRSMEVAGKTGSLSSKSPDGIRRHNSWFIGYAPADNPEIAIAALVVNDPKWRIKGTLLARKVMEAYFEGPRTTPGNISGKLPR